MLHKAYTNRRDEAIGHWLERLLLAARRRRLELGAECGEAEASRREVAAAAAALLAAVGLLAEEGRR
jgi:hypothetical protein